MTPSILDVEIKEHKIVQLYIKIQAFLIVQKKYIYIY